MSIYGVKRLKLIAKAVVAKSIQIRFISLIAKIVVGKELTKMHAISIFSFFHGAFESFIPGVDKTGVVWQRVEE